MGDGKSDKARNIGNSLDEFAFVPFKKIKPLSVHE